MIPDTLEAPVIKPSPSIRITNPASDWIHMYFPETSYSLSSWIITVIVRIVVVSLATILLVFLFIRWVYSSHPPSLSASRCLANSLILSVTVSLCASIFLSLVFHLLLFLLYLCSLTRRTRASRESSGLGEAAETVEEEEEEVRDRNDFWLNHPFTNPSNGRCLTRPVSVWDLCWPKLKLMYKTKLSWCRSCSYPPLWSPDNGTGHSMFLHYGHQIMVQVILCSSPTVTR